MKSGLSRSARYVAMAVLALAHAGCGGDEESRPPVVVITPEPVRAILAQTSFQGFAPDVWVSLELLLSQRGVLDITVDWTYDTTWMYVYLGRTNCTYDQLAGRTCPFFLVSETKDPKPRVLLTQTLEPGTYYLVLHNAQYDPATGKGGFGTESVALQLGLTVQPGDLRVPDGVTIKRTEIVAPSH